MALRAVLALVLLCSPLLPAARAADESPRHRAYIVFPLNERHNHAPRLVVSPDGQLLVSWYRGSGER